MDLKDIKAIIDLMRKNSVSEFELEKEGFKIRLKRAGNSNSPPIQSEDFAAVTREFLREAFRILMVVELMMVLW